jgi:glycosyltransferase involved in cell wall biosynthesis
MRIVVLGTRGIPDVPGGIEKHCEYLYPRLVEMGCDVTVLGRTPYTGSREYEYRGVHVVPLRCPRSRSLEAFTHTFIGVLTAKRIGCDILHIHGVGPSLCVPLARLLGLKVVMTHHGPDYERKKWGPFAKWVIKTGETWGSRSATEIICISDSIANDIRKRFNRDVTVIPNGGTISEISQTQDALREYGLERGKYVLAVGRFVPEKGFHDLVDAFAGADTGAADDTSSGGKWKLALVGASDHPDKYSRELNERARMSEDMILTGFLTGKPLHELYSHAGLFVLPSYYEGLPIVLLEAMSYGLSCVATDIPANRHVPLDDERFFDAGDIGALSEKITEFIRRPHTDEDRQAEISMIAERYSWDEIARRTLEVYRRILG